MAKDPAFMFYTNDFISGTQFMSNEEVGIYIRLLCAQHQHGRLSEKQVLFICKTKDNEVLQKFEIDEDGFYYNLRLENEINKRKSFSESRAKNRLGKIKDTKKQVKKKSKTLVKHMEDENRDENIYIINNKSEFEKTFDEFEKFRIKIKKPLTDYAKKLILDKLENLAPGNEQEKILILQQSITRGWQDVFPLKQTPTETVFTTRGKKYDNTWEPTNGINRQ